MRKIKQIDIKQKREEPMSPREEGKKETSA